MPAALASTGIFAREYFAPSGCFVYSIFRSFNKSKTPKTTAGILLLDDAISYVFTIPSADSIDGITKTGFSFRFFSSIVIILIIFASSRELFTFGITIPSRPFWTISAKSSGILPEAGEFVLT